MSVWVRQESKRLSFDMLCDWLAFKLTAADLSGELSQSCSDRQALLEQEAVKGVAVECLQIHLVFIIPELLRGVCGGCKKKHRHKEKDYNNIKNSSNLFQGELW